MRPVTTLPPRCAYRCPTPYKQPTARTVKGCEYRGPAISASSWEAAAEAPNATRPSSAHPCPTLGTLRLITPLAAVTTYLGEYSVCPFCEQAASDHSLCAVLKVLLKDRHGPTLWRATKGVVVLDKAPDGPLHQELSVAICQRIHKV